MKLRLLYQDQAQTIEEYKKEISTLQEEQKRSNSMSMEYSGVLRFNLQGQAHGEN